MNLRTLSNLVADVRFLADCANQTARYPTANIERLINEGYRAYLELIGGCATRVLRRVQLVVLGVGDDYLDVIARGRIRGVSCVDDDSESWYELEELTSDQAVAAATAVHQAGGTSLQSGELAPTPGRPLYWWMETMAVPAVADTTGSTGTMVLHLWPPTDRSRQMHLVVEEEPDTLIELVGKTPESSAYFPVPRGDEYVVAYAALKVAIRDADADKIQSISLLLSKLEQDIKRKARSYTGGVASRRDTRNERRMYGTRWP